MKTMGETSETVEASEEYEAGYLRGKRTGRDEPTDKDLALIEEWLGKTIEDISEVARGMAAGSVASI